MNRRAVVFNSIALSGILAFPALADAATAPLDTKDRDLARPLAYRTFLTRAELSLRVQALAMRHPSLITRRLIGNSRSGSPIELVTLAGGGNSALLVAGVHANEPIGSLTIDALMHRLVADDHLRRELDTTWHFVNPIDPDGMKLNEGWFKRPLTLESYYRDFYRPAVSRQPEYTFPQPKPEGRLSASPPENIAWQQALDLTKPDWQFSLHNAEFGGAFFLTSRKDAALEAEFVAIPNAHGIGLSSIGEPLGGFAARARGIFAMPRAADLIERKTGGRPATGWTGGDTSTAYADRYGTYSFTVEVPLWSNPRVMDSAASGSTLGDIIRAHLAELGAGYPMLERWSSHFALTGDPSDELLYALREQVASQNNQLLSPLPDKGHLLDALLTIGEASMYRVQLGLFGLRGHAMLARLARMRSTALQRHPAESEAQAIINARLAEMRRVDQLVPVPLPKIIGVQFQAALATARALRDQRRQDRLTGALSFRSWVG